MPLQKPFLGKKRFLLLNARVSVDVVAHILRGFIGAKKLSAFCDGAHISKKWPHRQIWSW